MSVNRQALVGGSRVIQDGDAGTVIGIWGGVWVCFDRDCVDGMDRPKAVRCKAIDLAPEGTDEGINTRFKSNLEDRLSDKVESAEARTLVTINAIRKRVGEVMDAVSDMGDHVRELRDEVEGYRSDVADLSLKVDDRIFP